MKVGIIKKDLAFPAPKTFWEKHAWRKAAKEILKIKPEYEFLWKDPWVKYLEDFREAVTCTYFVDCILEEHPELKIEYERIEKEQKEYDAQLNHSEEYRYAINHHFLCWYRDYLRDLADPGVVEREREAARQEYARLREQHKAEERQAARQEQQDLASGKRVVCPYCKSTNTEKISTVSRAVSVSLVGVASSKLGKQWHCKNCNSNF